MYIEGNVPEVVSGNNGNNGMFGDGWWGGIIGLIAVAAIFGGANGGLFGGGNRNGGVMDAYVLNSDFATLQRQLDSGFSGVTAGINQVNQGLCNGFYTNAQLINGVQMQVANEFRGLDNAVCNLGYQTQTGFNALGSQMASCCCDLKSSIQDVKYTIATESYCRQHKRRYRLVDARENRRLASRKRRTSCANLAERADQHDHQRAFT